MAYQTGTASSPNDLLDKLRIFAAAQGWTVDRNATAGSGKEVSLSKGSAFFSFRSFENESNTINSNVGSNKYGIALNGADAYSGAAAWDRQSGYPVSTTPGATDQRHAYVPFVTSFGPFPAYHFFTPDSKCVYVEIEVTTGTFQRFGFGSCDLFNSGATGGGRFFYGTGGNNQVTNSVNASAWLGASIDNSSFSQEEAPFRGADVGIGGAGGVNSGSFLRCAVDSFNGWAQSCRQNVNSSTGVACQGGGCYDRTLRLQSLNPLNGVGIMLPMMLALNRGDTFNHPVGTMPGMRYMDMTNYLPGDEFTLGSDTWKVFPWWQKGSRSFQYAIAYKKVP